MAEKVIARQTCDRCGVVRERTFVQRQDERPNDYNLVTCNIHGGGTEGICMYICVKCRDEIVAFAKQAPPKDKEPTQGTARALTARRGRGGRG